MENRECTVHYARWYGLSKQLDRTTNNWQIFAETLLEQRAYLLEFLPWLNLMLSTHTQLTFLHVIIPGNVERLAKCGSHEGNSSNSYTIVRKTDLLQQEAFVANLLHPSAFRIIEFTMLCCGIVLLKNNIKSNTSRLGDPPYILSTFNAKQL